MIEICDVGPRDVLLNKATSLSVKQWLELVRRTVGVGRPTVEVASLTNNCMQTRTRGRLDRGKDHSL
jgi:hypothetical protein